MSRPSLSQILPASLAIVPLVIAPGLLFYFDVTPKVVVLLIATALLLAFARPNKLTSREGRWFAGLVLAQMVSLAISAAFATDRGLAFTGGSWRRMGVIVECAVLIFALLLAAVPSNLRVLLRAVTAAGFLAALYGICQFFGFDPLLPASAYHAGEGIWSIVRPPSTLGNANYFAGYLIYACFYSAALFLTEASGIWKYLGAIAFAIDSAAIVLSGTRAAILGLFAGLVLLLIAAAPQWRKALLASASIGVALLAALYVSPAGVPLRARLRWSQEDALGGARLLLWRDSARMFASRFPIGYGPDQFGREFPGFQSIELAQAYPDFYQESPHNRELDAAIAQGLPGLLISLMLVALGLYAAWVRRKTHGALVACLAAALLGGVVAGQFTSPVLVTRLYELSTIAILCGMASTTHASRAVWLRPISCIAGAVFLLFGIALLASDLRAGALARTIQAKDPARSAELYRAMSTSAPPGFNVDLYASRAFLPLSFDEALRAGLRAVQTSEDRQNAFFNLAQLYARQNDIARTEQNLRAAMQVAPNWFKPHWVLAELLRRTGSMQEARRQAALAMELDAGKDPEVVRTWRQLGSPR